MSRKSAWLEVSMRMTLTLRASYFLSASGKGNIDFIKGTREGERVGVCVCAVIHNGKSRPFSYFTRF